MELRYFKALAVFEFQNGFSSLLYLFIQFYSWFFILPVVSWVFGLQVRFRDLTGYFMVQQFIIVQSQPFAS